MFDVIKHKTIFLGFAGLLVIAGVVSMSVFGFRLGVDFTGGSLWQLMIPNSNSGQIQEFFKSEIKSIPLSIAFDSGAGVYAVTLKEISDSDRQSYFGLIKSKFSDAKDLDFWSISSSVSADLRQKAIWGVVLVMLGISLYVAYVFRKVSRPISSWKYGLITLITLAHDVIIPAGVFAALGKFVGVTVDTNFIVALLVVMGFSVHDTIVVFDRIRENLLLTRGDAELSAIVNKSVNETFIRSLNTSLTLIMVLVALYLLGPVNLKFFILTMLIGTIMGTYSSIFVASPLLVVAQKLSRR